MPGNILGTVTEVTKKEKEKGLAVFREASQTSANDLRADGEDGLLAEAHLRNTLVPTYRAGD